VSSLVYPSGLKGLTYEGARTYIWRTQAFPAVSGKESRFGYQQYPLIRYENSYELLDNTLAISEYKAVNGLVNAMKGRFDTFLYVDPVFNTVSNEKFGYSYAVGAATGATQCDGTLKSFQLIAVFANATAPVGTPEIIQNLNGAPTIRDNGTIVNPANYTISGQGIVTFTTAPVAGHTLTWTGSFYQRCNFMTDAQDFSEFMKDWYMTKRLQFKTNIL
jgi:hypothetical protein